MAFKIRTGYEGDLSLFKTPQSIASYGVLLLVLCAAPFLVGSYFLSQIVFVMIYTIVGIGLVLLSGYAGQTSIGHAAFLAIGAYIAANATKFGVPLYIYLPAAGLLTGLVGWLVGLPALRLHGIYLAIATFAFALIVEEILARWETVTHGNEGLMVKPASLFGQPLGEWGLYYLCIGVTIFVIVIAVNVIRSPTGRAFLALRDSETAARSMGVDSARYKTFAFALSAGMTGLAGVLYAHKMSFISPEMFTLALSIEFVMIIIIGGIASLRGAALGAIFMIMVDPMLVLVKDKLPALIGANGSYVTHPDTAKCAKPCEKTALFAKGLEENSDPKRPDRQLGDVKVLSEDKSDVPAIACGTEGCFVAWHHEQPTGAQVGMLEALEGRMIWHKQIVTGSGGRPALASNTQGDVAVAFYEQGKLNLASITRGGIGVRSTFAKSMLAESRPYLTAGQKRGEWYVGWLDSEAAHAEALVAHIFCAQ